MTKQHYSTEEGSDAPEYSPFKRVCSIRKVTFADGSTETLARFIDVQAPEIRRGGGYIRGGDEVDPEGKAERCRRMAEARARREVRWAIASIGADHLLTCTFRENLADHRAARAVWQRFTRLVKARYPKWKYVAVMELQERGAIHFHAAVVGFQDVNYLRTAWRAAAGAHGGNIDVKGESRRWGGSGHQWRRRGLSSYIAKYLSKAFAWMPKHSQRFTASDDRVRPTITRWWLQYVDDDGAVIESVYRLTCGVKALGARQWLSPDGNAYVVSCEGPPDHPAIPF